MLTYKYLPNPKVGDLIGYASTYKSGIVPAAIVGFGKQGNIHMVMLEKRTIDLFKTPKDKRSRYSRNPVQSIASHQSTRAVSLDKAHLAQSEIDLYDYLVHNKPLP